ncbi:pilus assembly protein FimV [Polynucleobacter sp. IMCC30063]|uniref:type IV pilus assembly protein FimV n=1 Tax=Polynucleobacter sp. IMCC30063 TaxID=2907298 RepID=UPI001F42AF2A|nr:FimV/HubP family polar landmark protein [Polynucleobacter sp. IMCC30063]MCE7506051.1 pilus assembly protein FimV [Polynucleobacter sp. IMCC30063]
MPILNLGCTPQRFSFFAVLIWLVALAWGHSAMAVSLGSPLVTSQPGEPFRAEIPLLLSPDEMSLVEQMTVEVPSSATFDRFSISKRVLELKPQAQIRLGKSAAGQNQYQLLIQSDRALSDQQDPFLDLLVQLTWPSGNISKVYSLLVVDAQKVVVQPGQTLSEIALQMAPQLGGASLDETLLALYKANPDAFAGGSIHRLNAGAELYKPSQALLQSITPAAAKSFVSKSNETWVELKKSGDSSPTKNPDSKLNVASKSLKEKEINKNEPNQEALDRLKIGPGIGVGAEQRRFQEELVMQEQALSQARVRAAELEKNIADLQILLNQQKAEQQGAKPPPSFTWGPVLLVVSLLLLTGGLFWLLARYTRQAETRQAFRVNETSGGPFQPDSPQHAAQRAYPESVGLPEMPARAKALFAGLNLDLDTPPQFERVDPQLSASSLPLAFETLQVKFNLARAYVTIEDFVAARTCLNEIICAELATDIPAHATLIVAAQHLLQTLNERSV